MERNKTIIKTSIQGIIVNVILVIFKAVVGVIANSIAIILDAVNNLSDAISSIITIIGTKLAGRKPDKEHPYGHGRIEYFASLIIAVIVLVAGVTSGKESIEKIIHPVKADYTIASLIIIIVAIWRKNRFAKLNSIRHRCIHGFYFITVNTYCSNYKFNLGNKFRRIFRLCNICNNCKIWF